jgi:hypothetical protein
MPHQKEAGHRYPEQPAKRIYTALRLTIRRAKLVLSSVTLPRLTPQALIEIKQSTLSYDRGVLVGVPGPSGHNEQGEEISGCFANEHEQHKGDECSPQRAPHRLNQRLDR